MSNENNLGCFRHRQLHYPVMWGLCHKHSQSVIRIHIKQPIFRVKLGRFFFRGYEIQSNEQRSRGAASSVEIDSATGNIEALAALF